MAGRRRGASEERWESVIGWEAAQKSGNKHFYFWQRSHEGTVHLLPFVSDKSSFIELPWRSKELFFLRFLHFLRQARICTGLTNRKATLCDWVCVGVCFGYTLKMNIRIWNIKLAWLEHTRTKKKTQVKCVNVNYAGKQLVNGISVSEVAAFPSRNAGSKKNI